MSIGSLACLSDHHTKDLTKAYQIDLPINLHYQSLGLIPYSTLEQQQQDYPTRTNPNYQFYWSPPAWTDLTGAWIIARINPKVPNTERLHYHTVYQSATLSHTEITHGITIYPQIQKIAIFFTRIIGKWLIIIYRDLSQDSPYHRDHPAQIDLVYPKQRSRVDVLRLPRITLHGSIPSISVIPISQRSHGQISILSYTNLSNP